MATVRIGGRALCLGWSNWGPFFRLEALGKRICIGRNYGVVSFSERHGYIRAYRFLGIEVRVSDSGR